MTERLAARAADWFRVRGEGRGEERDRGEGWEEEMAIGFARISG